MHMHIILHVRIQLLGAKIYEKCFTVKVEKSRDYCRASSVRMAFIPRHVGAAVSAPHRTGPVKTTRGALQNVLKTNISPSRTGVKTNAFPFYSQSIIYCNNGTI